MDNLSGDLKEAYFSSIKELKEGDVVKGKIICVDSQGVVVDVGYKSEGIIPKEEFEGILDLDKLSEIDVYVDNVEDEEGKIVLSFAKAREAIGWYKISTEYKEGDLVEGIITKKVKGGYMVSVFGVEGFLPQSLSFFRGSESEIIGNKFYFQIVKMNKLKQNFIVSRKDAVRQERELMKQKIWEEIKPGEIRKGRVKNITNFGVFIDLGGVDGLLHIADMSWKKISHPSEMVAVGDEIEVMVLSADKEKGKISLGLKQTIADPWEEIEKKYPVGSIIKGSIVNIQNYGLFVELEKGIEGLVHISEISWSRKYINLNESFAIGDIVEAKVIGVDAAEKRISLSIKQIEKDPWEDIESLVNIDSVVKGKVIGFGENCAYIELDNGLEGIIYNEDLSWTKRVTRAQEILKRTHSYEFKVLGLDRSNRRVILGRKQLTPDPWPQIIERYPKGKVLEGEVVKVTNFGVFVKLEEELEGLVFSGEIDKEKMESLKPKDKLKVKIIKIDPDSAKVGLSTKIDEETN
ncbi:MAG: S1 RNA-binding domain-containing protein [Candidatus Omnitrophica bacterium]|nr:S1 RNA-binding domain-containing protein [Candidatus Omnitrophota bacterium]